MGIFNGYDDRTPLQREWDAWLDEFGGKPFADADAAYAEMQERHSLAQEREYHRPLLGNSLRRDAYVDPKFKP